MIPRKPHDTGRSTAVEPSGNQLGHPQISEKLNSGLTHKIKNSIVPLSNRGRGPLKDHLTPDFSALRQPNERLLRNFENAGSPYFPANRHRRFCRRHGIRLSTDEFQSLKIIMFSNRKNPTADRFHKVS